MRSAIVCIAKNEDHYIDEWLDYHLKLGFSDIFIYENNWRYAGDKSLYSEHVHWIPFDGEFKQLEAYNDFIDNRSTGFNFAGFFDVDEFLCLKVDSDANSFLSRYSSYFGVTVNWRIFGDSSLTEPTSDYSVINRFTMCEAKMNEHIKTFLNIARCRNNFHFVNPHCVDVSLQFDAIVDTSKSRFVHGPFNRDASGEIAQLNHYNVKTLAEYKEKMSRGRADCTPDHPLYHYSMQIFEQNNKNEREDLTLLKAYAKLKSNHI